MIGKINPDKTIEVYLNHTELCELPAFEKIQGVLIQKFSNLRKEGICGTINIMEKILERHNTYVLPSEVYDLEINNNNTIKTTNNINNYNIKINLSSFEHTELLTQGRLSLQEIERNSRIRIFNIDIESSYVKYQYPALKQLYDKICLEKKQTLEAQNYNF
jgi:hypothetical protein